MTPKTKLSDIVVLVTLGIVVQLIAVVLAASVSASRFSLQVIAGISNDACWILGYVRLSHRRDWISPRARFAPVGSKILVASALAALTLIALLSAVTELLKSLGIRVGDIPPDVFDSLDRGRLPFLVVYFVVIGPVAEELMFRGLLLDWLRQKLTVWPAVLVTSLIFALLHNNNLHSGVVGWLQLADRLAIGVATSILALRYKSLLPGFVLHATNNGVVILGNLY